MKPILLIAESDAELRGTYRRFLAGPGRFRFEGAVTAMMASALHVASATAQTLQDRISPQRRRARREIESLAKLRRSIEDAASRPPGSHRSRRQGISPIGAVIHAKNEL
jgi:hypothetical protein